MVRAPLLAVNRLSGRQRYANLSKFVNCVEYSDESDQIASNRSLSSGGDARRTP